MDFTGFNKPYPANRPLTTREWERKLDQKLRLDVQESDDLSAISFNSTYLELVDKWFAWRGFPAMTGLVLSSMVIAFIVDVSVITLSTPGRLSSDWPALLAFMGLATPLLALLAWLIRKDGFRFTHYPIRLNRKTRTVHVFRADGTVLSTPWNDLFFCIAALPKSTWEIQGHVLDTDGVTVKETFAFPATATGVAEREQLRRYWEFVRRYMEDGPQAVSKRVEYCLPIADRREGFKDGFHRMHGQANALFAPLLIVVLLFLYILPYPGRCLAMRTSKLPAWPKEVEDSCVIETDDPYRKDASTNHPITDHSLIYLVVACGTGLLVWVWW